MRKPKTDADVLDALTGRIGKLTPGDYSGKLSTDEYTVEVSFKVRRRVEPAQARDYTAAALARLEANPWAARERCEATTNKKLWFGSDSHRSCEQKVKAAVVSRGWRGNDDLSFRLVCHIHRQHAPVNALAVIDLPLARYEEIRQRHQREQAVQRDERRKRTVADGSVQLSDQDE